jgi:hypothetical protein
MILLPYPNFILSARILETKRIAETLHGINELLNEHFAPENEANYILWGNYRDPLSDYGNILSKQLIVRGFKNKIPFPYHVNRIPYCLPPFFGKESYHAAHRKFLLQMNPTHYTKFFKRS